MPHHARKPAARRQRIFALLAPLLAACLTSCVDLYADRYTPAVYGQNFTPVAEAQIIEVKNVSAEVVKQTDFPDATVVGTSSFTVSSGPQGDPKKLAESLGADIVIVSRLYATTKRELRYDRIPETYTYYDHKGNLQTRTYTQAIPTTRNVSYYRYEAMFLRTQ